MDKIPRIEELQKLKDRPWEVKRRGPGTYNPIALLEAEINYYNGQSLFFLGEALTREAKYKIAIDTCIAYELDMAYAEKYKI